MKNLIIAFIILVSSTIDAKITAMFHPYDNTFEAISERLLKAERTIDMALYNIDSSTTNPIIQTILSESIQEKLKNGTLKIRMIFEGYESKDKNKVKMLKLESYGIDVRHLGSSRKMHHKFAVIDGNTFNSSLVTGSANWSMSSRKNYSENILFFDQEVAMSQEYQKQFDFLWDLSKEVGHAYEYNKTKEYLDIKAGSNGVEAYFNTDNFVVKNNKLYKSKDRGYALTKRIVKAIDAAQTEIKIASTRIKLRPIYDAILRAADRGVKVDIVVTMGEYEYKSVRNKNKLALCENPFEKKCSTSKNFSAFLSKKSIAGNNIKVRAKFFNFNLNAYLNKQMHSKYILIDGVNLITGSFNWSYSAEFNHIENIVEIDGIENPEIIENFEKDFDGLWELRRGDYKKVINRLNTAAANNDKANCSFEPMSLSFNEIDYLLNSARRLGKSLKTLCAK